MHRFVEMVYSDPLSNALRACPSAVSLRRVARALRDHDVLTAMLDLATAERRIDRLVIGTRISSIGLDLGVLRPCDLLTSIRTARRRTALLPADVHSAWRRLVLWNFLYGIVFTPIRVATQQE